MRLSGLYRVVEQVSWKLKQGRPRWECTCAWMWLPSCFSFWCVFVGNGKEKGGRGGRGKEWRGVERDGGRGKGWREGEGIERGGGRGGEGWRGGGDLATRLGLWPSPRSFWCVFVGHITTGVIIQTRWSGQISPRWSNLGDQIKRSLKFKCLFYYLKTHRVTLFPSFLPPFLYTVRTWKLNGGRPGNKDMTFTHGWRWCVN